MAEHACGPTSDVEFFDAVLEVFNRFPEVAKNYSIECVDHETDIMKIDFKKETGIARIAGKRVVTDYASREELAAGLICCKWWRENDSTWTCLKRWDSVSVGPDDPIFKKE